MGHSRRIRLDQVPQRLATAAPPSEAPGGFIFFILAAIVLAVAGVGVWFLFAILPNVPSIDAVTDYKPKIPLRIYTADNVLIGEFGEEHRDFVPIAQIPPMMKKAVLAIEDARFYEHRRHRLDGRGARGACRTCAAASAGRRLDDHDAGGAQLLPVARKGPVAQAQRSRCWPTRSRTR